MGVGILNSQSLIFASLFLGIPLLLRTIVPPIWKSLMVSSFLSNYGTLEYLSSTQRSLPSESFSLFVPFSIYRVQCDCLDHLKVDFSLMSQSFIGFNFKGGYLGFIMVVITIRDPVHNSEFSSVWVPSAFTFVKAYLGFIFQVNSIHNSEFATVWVPSAFNFMKAYLGFKFQFNFYS